MGFFNLNFGFGNNSINEPVSVEKDNAGNWFYTMFSSKNRSKRFVTEKEKIETILSSPACLKVFALNCDLFSLGKINTKETSEYLKTLRKKPNYKQNWTQFKWDYMFWTMTGTAYLYKSGGRLLNDSNTLQWLNPANLVWEGTLLNRMKDFIFTKATFKEIMSSTVKYNFGNGKSKYIPLDEITPIFDLSNGMSDNFYQGVSRVDALYKIICNSEEALDAININLEFSKKFVVSGKQDPSDVTKVPMGIQEKEDIETKVRGGKSVHAMRSQIDIKRFVDNISALKLDDAYSNAYYNIGSMFGIPKDILEVYNQKGTTYENQEKSIVRHIEYTLKPKGKNLTDVLEDVLDINDTEMVWSDMACYQVFEKEKQEVIALKLENAILAKENDIKIDDL